MKHNLLILIFLAVLFILISTLSGCAQDPGELILTDRVFVLPGCEEAKKRNADEPC